MTEHDLGGYQVSTNKLAFAIMYIYTRESVLGVFYQPRCPHSLRPNFTDLYNADPTLHKIKIWKKYNPSNMSKL